MKRAVIFSLVLAALCAAKAAAQQMPDSTILSPVISTAPAAERQIPGIQPRIINEIEQDDVSLSTSPVPVAVFLSTEPARPSVEVSTEPESHYYYGIGFLKWYDAECGLLFNRCLMSSAMSGADKMQGSLSRRVTSTATRLDRIISRKPISEEENQSSVLVSPNFQVMKSTRNVSFDINMKLRLPHTEGRLHLVIEHVGNEVLPVENISQTQSRLAEGEQAAGSYIGLRYLFNAEKALREHIDFGIRADVGGKPPFFILKPYAKTNVSYDFDIYDWDAKIFTQVMWNAHTTLDCMGGFYTGRPLSKDMALTSYANAVWNTGDAKVTIYETLSTPWKFSERDVVTPAFQIQAFTQPVTQVSIYTISLSWRRRLRENWLSGELTPSLNYPRDTNYSKVWGLAARLDIFFGAGDMGAPAAPSQPPV